MRMSKWSISSVLVLMLLLVGLFALSVGSVKIPVQQTWRMVLSRLPLLSPSESPLAIPHSHQVIIFKIRMPRVLLAALVGGSLALAGAVFQGIFRNPMADPYVIGVSSGAAVGAVAAIIVRANYQQWAFAFGPKLIPFWAMISSLLTIGTVYVLARRNGRIPVLTLLLAGVAMSSFLSALVSLMIFFYPQEAGPVVFWLMGGLAGSSWSDVVMMVPYVIVGAAILLSYPRELNAILLGETSARQLGVEVEKVKLWLLGSASLLTAAAVSVSGIIAFVGLITPHILRLILGPDHRALLPTSALLGGVVLILADTAARTLLSPSELPVGLVTSLLGAPFFLYILRRYSREGRL